MERKKTENSLDASKELDDPPSSANISDLNNDCLILIFQQLNILDRLRLERVCKRWQVLLKESWYDFHTFRFVNEDWGFKDPRDLDDLNTRKFKKVLRRCGKFVKNIELNYSSKKLGPNVYSTISKYCPNIESIKDYGDKFKFRPESIRALAQRCSNLVTIWLGVSTKNCDEELALLFRRNIKLKSVRFSRDPKITGECLSALNADEIEVFHIDNCIDVSMKYLAVLRNFKNLKELILNDFPNDIIDDVAEDISERFYNLRLLFINRCPIFPFSTRQMAKLHNIQELNVSENDSITDDLLVAVGNYCKSLEDIHISFCNLVTNRGLSAILTLPCLEILYAESLDNINDEVFNCVPELEELDCNNCVNMKDEGIARLIKNSHNIEKIYLEGCEKISNRLITDAIRYTKMRKNNVVLNIYLSEGQVNLDEIADSSPLLKVHVGFQGS